MSLIGDSLNDEPLELPATIESFVRSFGLMEFIGVCKLVTTAKKQASKINFFSQLKKNYNATKNDKEGEDHDHSHMNLDQTVHSFEKVNAMLPAEYTNNQTPDGAYTPLVFNNNTNMVDTSAMNLGAMSDYDLSQIMNPNVDIMLDDDQFLDKHVNTAHSADFLWKVFFFLEKKIHKNDMHQLAIAFSSIQSMEANHTLDLIGMNGKKRQESFRIDALRRCLLILSGCI